MRKYILTNDDYFKAEIAIYNDLPQTLVYSLPEGTKKKRTESFKKHLLKGEKYIRLDYDEELSDAVITSYGRVFNTITGKQLKPLIFRQNLTVYFRGERLQLPKLFKKYGWECNLKDIYARYIDYGWTISKNRSFVEGSLI